MALQERRSTGAPGDGRKTLSQPPAPVRGGCSRATSSSGADCMQCRVHPSTRLIKEGERENSENWKNYSQVGHNVASV